MEPETTTIGLPENAYKELKAGEEYSPDHGPREDRTRK